MKIPKPIVDRNGKQTTVFVNPFKKESGSSRLGTMTGKTSLSSNGEFPAIWDSDHTARFNDQQVKRNFPLASRVTVFSARPMLGDSNSIAQFISHKIQVSRNTDLVHSVDLHVAANLASDFYDLPAIWSQGSGGQSVSLVLTADIPSDYIPSDIADAYDSAAGKLAEIKRTSKTTFAAELRKQNAVTKKVLTLSAADIGAVAQGDNAEAIRVIPHLDSRIALDGAVYMDMAANPNTPDATILEMVKGYRRFKSGTEHMAYEAFENIKASRTFDQHDSISLDVQMKSIKRDINLA